jgi:hypothetical protein
MVKSFIHTAKNGFFHTKLLFRMLNFFANCINILLVQYIIELQKYSKMARLLFIWVYLYNLYHERVS